MKRFGGVVQAREKSRDANVLVWLATFGQDLRYAVRGLRRSPGVTAVAVLSLALAIGVNGAIFSIVNAVLLRALPYKDSARIVMLWTGNALNGAMEQNTSAPNLDDWKARNHAFDDLAAYRDTEGPVAVNGLAAEPEWAGYAWVTGNFFGVLGRAPERGRVFEADEFSREARVAVIGHRLWQRQFGGSAEALGRVLNVAGQQVEIIGIMPDDFRFPSRGAQVWLPASLSPVWRRSQADRGARFGTVFGRLREGVSFERAREEMRLIAAGLARQYPKANQDLGVNLVPLQVQVNGKSVPFMLAILFGAVMFVLAIACANVGNLLLARGAARSREIALRVALGAGRARIARQLLTESILLSCAAGCLSLPLAALGIPALLKLAPADIARLDEVHADLPVLLFTFAVSLVSGVVFGLAPAIRISRNGPGSALGQARNAASGRPAQGLRGAFVICQIALAVILLTGAGLLIRSLVAVQSVAGGFENRGVLTASLRFDATLPAARRAASYRRAMDRIGSLPGVRAVGAIGQMFWSNGGGKLGLRAVEGQAAEPRGQWSALSWTTVGGDYFQALGVPLLRGRFFDDRDQRDAPPVVLVNETMARRYWPREDAIGKRIKGFDARGRNDDWVMIVGVVRDVRSRGLEQTPMAQIFEPQSQSFDGTENLVVASASADGLGAAVGKAVHEVEPAAVLSDIATLGGRLRDQTAPRRFQTNLLGAFAALALALAGAGIFGTTHYSVAQRTQEIGIRMALGARRGDVSAMVLREGLTLAAVGVALGAAGSLALMRTIASLLFGVTATDPATFGAVSLTLAAVALAGCYLPARRAAKVDPMVALRCD